MVECGGYSGAAKRLSMSDANISIHMTNLEYVLGTVLCTRGRSGFQLTPEGERIHEASQALMLAHDNFSTAVGTAKGQLAGDLQLGVIDNSVFDPNLKIPELVKHVKKIAPEVDISIYTQSPLELCRGILEQRLHLAIGVFYDHQPGLKYFPICTDRMTLYCGKTHPLYNLEKTSTKEIQKHAFVERNYGATLNNTNVPIKARIQAYTSSLEAALLLILSGQYIGFLPENYAQQWSDAGKIKAVLPKSLFIETELIALVHSRPANSLMTNTLLNIIFQEAAKNN